MKSILSYIILAAVLLASCSKEDDPVFSETADQRINRVLAEYEAALTSSPNGWNAEMTTKNEVTYRFHFSFDKSNRVKMFSDFDGTTAAVRKESSYRLKALQQPALLFDTYSYIHILTDPADSISGGPVGVGLNADFEFSLDSLSADLIKLTGRQQGSKMILRKASAQDADAWQTGKWAGGSVLAGINKRILNYWKRLTVGTRQYEIVIDPSFHTLEFTWRNAAGTPQRHTTSFNYSAEGMILTEPLQDGANTITSLSAATWNNGTAAFTLTVNNNTAGRIAGAIAPIVNDANAPERWWNEGLQDYWRTVGGFTVNGVWNAYKLANLKDYYYLAFLEQWEEVDGVEVDIFGFVFLGGNGLELRYGLATYPPVFTGGRIVFPQYGVLGTIPPEAEDAFYNTAITLINPNGFYLVQTGQNRYDMVSASDAKSWITWQR
ncbi:DUF4302 domain-containing protein [Chitinophaga pollutisoli]|uniref:DUF4302 domain-containing protein n=1 Tax=Chitinophaga pollutisoli TaxID=3133966 RepID=A0ABZ2YTA9_9BACT